ncbi:MAG: hypothetical protein P8Q17_04245 [Methylophilaceae bacterium]|nr:hypothetical protein [Methylophilaceae bacterium]
MNKLFYFVLVTLLMSGCGAEIAYKQGASARDLQANKAACQDAATEAALHACLEKNGWAVQKLGEQWLSDEDLFATASATDNDHITNKPKKDEGLKTTDSIKTEVAPIQSQANNKVSKKETVVVEKAIDKMEPPVKPTANILDTYEIKSWWKMGGGAAQLDQNMEECTAALGEAHKPNKATFTFTRGFAICMREKGWRGLISQNK